MARVSILLPVRDAAATLPACLRSIRRQRYRDWSCTVVDDGSADGTRALLEQAADTDPRFRLCEAGAPGGLIAALQRGLQACDGELIARADADDLLHRDRLSRQVAALDAAPALDLVGCHARPFPTRALGTGTRAYAAWLRSIRTAADVVRDAFVECPLLHPTWCARTETLRAHGYRAFDGPEDYDLLLRLLAAGHRVGVVPRTLLAWRRAPGSLSQSDPRYAIAAFTRLKAHHLARGLLADHDGYVLWGHGGTGRALRRALADHDRQPALVVELHPGRIGQRIHGAPVVAPDALPRRPGLPIVVSVAGPAARREIRAFLGNRGLVDGRDFVCAA